MFFCFFEKKNQNLISFQKPKNNRLKKKRVFFLTGFAQPCLSHIKTRTKYV